MSMSALRNPPGAIRVHGLQIAPLGSWRRIRKLDGKDLFALDAEYITLLAPCRAVQAARAVLDAPPSEAPCDVVRGVFAEAFVSPPIGYDDALIVARITRDGGEYLRLSDRVNRVDIPVEHARAVLAAVAGLEVV